MRNFGRNWKDIFDSSLEILSEYLKKTEVCHWDDKEKKLLVKSIQTIISKTFNKKCITASLKLLATLIKLKQDAFVS